MEEMESMQWQKIATEDLKQGGSLRVERKSPVFLADIERMAFEELCYKYPKVAIEKISEDYKIYCEKVPHIDFTVEVFREPKMVLPSKRRMSFFKRANVRKPSIRPRNLTEVLLNTQHLEFFREFLRERRAETPLQFLVAIQKISVETNEKIYNSLFENVIKTFFHGKNSPEQMLQCNAPLIKEVSLMHHVSTTTLLMLQGFVMRSLEEKWFKDYQELFPPQPLEKEAEIPIASPKKPSKTAVYLQESQKRGWLKMISFIRSFCNYRRFMSHPHKRQELEDYLHLEVHNKENFSTAPNISGRPMPNPSVRSTDHENGDIVLMKRRVFGHRIIIINYAVNDFYFFSEMEKFNDLVSSARVLQVNRAYNENDVILMKSKISIILKLYLHADVPPRLRVNISDAQKDAILTAISDGRLDRSIFHGAIMSVFPIIMYFWKRFCAWKAIQSYFQYMGKKFKDIIISPKPVYKYPPWSGGDQAILRFTLCRGIEWLRPQPRDAAGSSVQNSSSSIFTQSRHAISAMQLCPVPGPKLPSTKKERK